MSVRIIIDSTADVIPAVKERVYTVPMTVHFGEEEYVDGVTITHREFYEKLIDSDVVPHTSQATPAMYGALFEQVAAAGDSAVVITLAQKLSGTYQSAVMAAEEYANIYVVDSASAAIGSGILAQRALQLADSGMDTAVLVETLEREKQDVRVVALLDTLEYLKRGGRISKTAAIAGGLLSIKPVICLQEGEITVLGKARGCKQGHNLLNTEIEKAGGVDFDRPVLLGYTGLEDTLLQQYIANSDVRGKAGGQALPIACVGSVIGTHAGPGAIAAAFFRKRGG